MKYIFNIKKNTYVEATKWMLLKYSIKHWFTKWKFINRDKYCLIPWENRKYYFRLSEKEHKEAEKIYKEKGTISYEFYPCGGIGWGVKVKVLKTGEIVDITDVNSW